MEVKWRAIILHFSCLDVFASTIIQKMRNSNLFHKITGTSYETGFDLQITQMFHNGDHARPPSFSSERACMRTAACVCVSALAQACEWQAVSERDVIIWLLPVWVVTGGRVTSLVGSWHCGRETLLYDFPMRGETLLSQSAAPLSDFI